jgi:hypothetical protein
MIKTEPQTSCPEGVIPVWSNDKLPLLREEEDGLWMVYPPKNPRPHFLNETAVFLLDRCDGQNDVLALVLQLSRQYPNVPVVRIETDTINCLYFLRTLGLIRWNGEKYLQDNTVANDMTEAIHFRMAGESDFGRVSVFLQQYFHDLSEDKNRDSFHLMTPADIRRGAYEDISIRTRQFHLVENFFCLDKADKLQGVCSINMAATSPVLASFVVLAVREYVNSKEIYRDLISKTIFYLKHHKVYRVKIPLIPSSVDEEVRRFLAELGFEYEATLLDELGQDQNLDLWSIKLT